MYVILWYVRSVYVLLKHWMLYVVNIVWSLWPFWANTYASYLLYADQITQSGYGVFVHRVSSTADDFEIACIVWGATMCMSNSWNTMRLVREPCAPRLLCSFKDRITTGLVGRLLCFGCSVFGLVGPMVRWKAERRQTCGSVMRVQCNFMFVYAFECVCVCVRLYVPRGDGPCITETVTSSHKIVTLCMCVY